MNNFFSHIIPPSEVLSYNIMYLHRHRRYVPLANNNNNNNNNNRTRSLSITGNLLVRRALNPPHGIGFVGAVVYGRHLHFSTTTRSRRLRTKFFRVARTDLTSLRIAIFSVTT